MLRTDLIWKTFSCKLLTFIQANVHNGHDAEDLLQEVFLKIHMRLDSLRDIQKVEGWIFQITRNVIRDYYRKRNRNTSESLLEDPMDMTEREVEFMSDIQGCVASLIKQLPDLYRIPIEKVYLEEKKQIDVAEELGLSVSTAKSRIQRGRNLLKQTLNACCDVKDLKDMDYCSCHSPDTA